MGKQWLLLAVVLLAACSGTVAPVNPTNLAARATLTPSIELSWDTQNGAQFLLERKNASGDYVELTRTASPSYTDTAVSFGTAYSYRLKATNAVGASDWVGLDAAAVPAQPANLKIAHSSLTSIQLVWDAVEGANGYLLERKTDGGEYHPLAQPETPGFSDTTVAAGSSYAYRVRAANAGGNSNPSNEASVPSLVLPLDPSNPSATAQTTSKAILIAWQTGAGAERYSLERKTPLSEYVLLSDSISGTTFNDTDAVLSAATTYTYRIKSRNAAGPSSGTEVSVSTPALPPAPTNLQAVANSSTGVTVSWNSSSGAAAYTLERRPGGGVYAQLATPEGTLFSDTGLAAFKTYFYRVRANSIWGSSDSVEVGLTTYPYDFFGKNADDPTDPATRNFNPDPAYSSRGYFGNISGRDDLYTTKQEGWPVVPTFASLLPPDKDGKTKVFAWYSMDEYGQQLGQYDENRKGTLAVLWDYTNPDPAKAFEIINNNNHTDLFCAGFVVLPDGRLYTAGGHIGYWGATGYPPGSAHTDIFDPQTKTWSAGPDMHDHRWYPTVITLSDGRLLIVGGSGYNAWSADKSQNVTNATANQDVEIWNTQTNQVSRLLGAQLSGPTYTPGGLYSYYYPWLFQVPNGKVFSAGAGQLAYLDYSGNGQWSNLQGALSGGFYGTAAMYAPGKIIGFGGGGPASDVVYRVNLDYNNDGDPSNDGTNFSGAVVPTRMTVPRTHLNATLLPDGKVFVNGGNQSGANWVYDTNYYGDGGVREDANKVSELWDPVAGTRSSGAKAQIVRQYHSIALLLPDGRVLTAGGGGNGYGLDSGRDLNQRNSEMYYPPYLFKPDGQLAPRPTITAIPKTLSYNSSFTLQTDLPARQISKVTLLKLGSVTHAFNMGQHVYYPTIQSRVGNQLEVATPPSGKWAPPGFYMVFVLDDHGIMSEASVVRLP